MENTALLIIDVQNDYFPGGKMTLEKAEEAGQNTKKFWNISDRINFRWCISYIFQSMKALLFPPRNFRSRDQSIGFSAGG